MKNKNTIEDEIDVIRLTLYAETKHMVPSEKVAYLRQQAQAINDKYGLKPIARTTQRLTKLKFDNSE
ncbi:MAG: hypothetical protein LBK52_07555 [Deltaproteobacteria bacterium]|jgi:hypothetical protein|nr:hypothetical protein [Deltaproteobacteria bacterium]